MPRVRPARLRPSRLRRNLLPGVLLTAVGAAGAGLWALDPAAPPAEVTLSTSLLALPVPPPPVAQPVQDPLVVVARASRSRRLEVAAAERARRVALAAAAARAREAKAAAAAAAQESARRRLTARACPVPSASFIDSWGFGRSGGRAHKGTDMMAPAGEPIYAVRSGTVRTSSGGMAGLGIYLTDVEGTRYFYAHNSVNLVRSGEHVEAGELIGRVGATGNARGGPSHVHFELQPGGRAVRSYAFLREIC